MTHWLLEMQIGGRIHRYAQQPLEVTDARGAVWTYAAGLGDVELSVAASYTLGDASADVEITSDEDWGRIAALGVPLDGGQAVLRLWREGTLLERARVMLRGRVAQPTYGATGEPLTVIVQRSLRGQAAQIPHPRMSVDLETWTEPAKPAIGLTYPVVIGAPGHTETAVPIPCVPVPQVFYAKEAQEEEETFTGIPELDWVTPAIALNYAPLSAQVFYTPNGGSEVELIKNVHWRIGFDLPAGALVFATNGQLVLTDLWTGTSADTIRIVYWYIPPVTYEGTRSTVAWIGGHATQVRFEVMPPIGTDLNGPLITDQTVTPAVDLLSQPVQVVNRAYPLPGGNYYQIGSPDDQLYVGFRDDGVYGGGIKYRGNELLRGAGDVLDYMLSRYYSGQVDAARTAAARQYLNSWQIDAWIEESVNAWDWLQSEILPLLPVEMRESADGIYPAIIRYDVTAVDARGRLVANENAVRDSAVSYTSGEIINEVIIKYRPVRDTWQGQRTLTAQAEKVSIGLPNQQLGEAWSTNQPGFYGSPDERVLGHQRAALSQAKYGLKSKEVKAAALWDTASAILTATWMLDRYALSRRRIRYRVEEDRWDVGDVLLLTDADVHLSDEVAIITDVTPEPGGDFTLDLVLVES